AGVGASERLEAWATAVGRLGGARIDAPYQSGWCSWYHYFHDVSETALRANLAHAAELPFHVFQLDDGFHRSIGDWLPADRRLPVGSRGRAARDRGGRPPARALDRALPRRAGLRGGAGAPRVARPAASGRRSAARHVQPRLGWRAGRLDVRPGHDPPGRARA